VLGQKPSAEPDRTTHEDMIQGFSGRTEDVVVKLKPEVPRIEAHAAVTRGGGAASVDQHCKARHRAREIKKRQTKKGKIGVCKKFGNRGKWKFSKGGGGAAEKGTIQPMKAAATGVLFEVAVTFVGGVFLVRGRKRVGDRFGYWGLWEKGEPPPANRSAEKKQSRRGMRGGPTFT